MWDFESYSESGECYTFGSNQFGQLGNGQDSSIDRQVHQVLEDMVIVMVSCGDTVTVAVSEGISVFLNTYITRIMAYDLAARLAISGGGGGI